MKTLPLKIFAGPDALNHMRKNGLRPDDISMVLAASGGPKWLVLGPIDRFLMAEWFHNRKRPLHLLGTSAGAWRMACYAQDDALAAHARFQEAYASQDYSETAGPRDVARGCRQILDALLGGNGAQKIIDHPVFRYHVIVARCRGMAGAENKGIQSLGMLLSMIGNAVTPGAMRPWVDRVLFHHPELPPIARFPHLPVRRVALTEENVGKALLATGAIPVVISGVTHIPGAPTGGTYRDGGLTDYQFDLPVLPGDGYVLYPHYTSRPPVGGWFDKKLPWRRASRAHYRRTIIVAPSEEFVATLPGGRLPDRGDFYAYKYPERRRRWDRALSACEELKDALSHIHKQQKWASIAEPLPW